MPRHPLVILLLATAPALATGGCEWTQHVWREALEPTAGLRPVVIGVRREAVPGGPGGAVVLRYARPAGGGGAARRVPLAADGTPVPPFGPPPPRRAGGAMELSGAQQARVAAARLAVDPSLPTRDFSAVVRSVPGASGGGATVLWYWTEQAGALRARDGRSPLGLPVPPPVARGVIVPSVLRRDPLEQAAAIALAVLATPVTVAVEAVMTPIGFVMWSGVAAADAGQQAASTGHDG